MTIEELLDLLSGVRKTGTGWTALCRAHDDKKSSLSISEGDGRILLHCFAGCDIESICHSLGIKVSDLFASNGNHRQKNPKPPTPKAKHKEPSPFQGTDEMAEEMRLALVKSQECQRYIESRGILLRVAADDLKWGFTPSWTFETDEGNTIRKPALAVPHYVGGKLAGVKFRTIDGTKSFSQMPGSSTDGLYGRTILDSNASSVVVVEGPEDCALLISHGLNAVAINSATATVTTSDIPLLSKYKTIFVVGDQDLAGQKAMNSLERRLPDEQVIRVRLPGYKDVGDLWKSNPAQFAQNLQSTLRFARASRAYFQFDDLLTESEIGAAGVERYAVDQVIPLNAPSMFFSEEKGGKSLLMTYIAKCVANGKPVFGKYVTRKMPVVVLDLEASDADIAGYLSHFSRLGSEQIRYFTRKTGMPALDSLALLQLCEQIRPLILLESLTKFVSAGGKDKSMFDPADMSRFFDKVLNLCAAGATVLISHHATRADAERYADSHQIGAAVVRAYALVSEDRPQLRRLRLEGKLSRGAAPITENLIAFPVIAERGEFGLSADSDPFASELEALVAFVRSQPGEACVKDTIKKRRGKSAKGNLKLLNLAIERGLLVVRQDKKISFPNARTVPSEAASFPSTGTVGNGDDES